MKDVEKILHILERRRNPTFETLDALSHRLSIPRGEISKNVGTVKLSFLTQHLSELYAAAEYLGVHLEDLFLFATREFMINKDPFSGSDWQQRFRKEIEEELEKTIKE